MNITKACEVCSKDFVTRASRQGRFCSVPCKNKVCKPPTGAGEANNNWRDAGRKVCLSCGESYHSYAPHSKYCSIKCKPQTPHEKLVEMAAIAAEKRRSQPKKPPQTRVRPSRYVRVSVRKIQATHKACAQCGSDFKCFGKREQLTRRFCTYQCHLDSGGARRAGDAAVRATMKYGAKKDANHKEVVDALNYFGASVLDLSGMGCGVPDILVWCRGNWHLCDIKNKKTGYGRRGLNPRQKEWADNWKGGPVVLLYSQEDAQALVQGNMDRLTSVGTR